MISALSWIPRGVAKALPSSEELEKDSEEMAIEGKSIEEEEEEEDDEEDEDEDDQSDDESMEEEEETDGDPVEKAKAIAAALKKDKKKNAKKVSKEGKSHPDDELAELDMENYEDEEDAGELRIFGNGGLGAAYYKLGEADPLLQGDDEEDEEDVDDLTIRPTDLLLVVARNEDDVSHLEVWVCEEAGGEEDELNMYVHHDVMLPAFPLSLAWVGCDIRSPSASEKGNFVAVGAMQPAIEIWDLDEIERVEPVAILGGAQTSEEAVAEGKKTKKGLLNLKTKKKKKEMNLVEGSHSDAVLGLAWNMEKRNLLASGSADCSVKVWDITTRCCETTLTHHTDKVQAVAWKPRDASTLLSGSFDRTAALADVRSPSSAVLQWSLTADVECLAWDPHTGVSFVVSTEDGLVKCHDVRMGGRDAGSAPLYTLHAHDKATCAVSFNHSLPNMLATASTDKMVKLWDTTDNKPTCIASTNPKVGAIFSLGFSGDSPFLLAMGGSKGELHIWDTLKNSAMSQRYGSSQVAT